MHDELSGYLDALERDDCYRVDAVLKESPHETTERVYFIGANGAEQGPFIRKRIGAGMGAAYACIYQAQRAGKRFLHIPRIIECEKTDSACTVVMEFVEGESLADLVYRRDSSIQLAGEVFPTLCDAVLELHEGFDPPLIHRDLKPSNVIVSNGNLTLIDFGIARQFDDSAAQDTMHFGTRGYAPPEQFGYGQTDERSDVYALGMLLYYLLVEKSPNIPLDYAALESAGVPQALVRVLERATAFDPAARYANVRELKLAFEQAMSSGYAAPDPHTRVRVSGESDPVPNAGVQSAFQSACTWLMGILSRIPRWVGVTWNICVVLFWLLFAAASVTLVVNPDEQAAIYPLWARSIMYPGMFGVGLGFLLYLALDKRGIKKRIPTLAEIPRGKVALTCILVFLGTTILALCVSWVSTQA